MDLLSWRISAPNASRRATLPFNCQRYTQRTFGDSVRKKTDQRVLFRSTTNRTDTVTEFSVFSDGVSNAQPIVFYNNVRKEEMNPQRFAVVLLLCFALGALSQENSALYGTVRKKVVVDRSDPVLHNFPFEQYTFADQVRGLGDFNGDAVPDLLLGTISTVPETPGAVRIFSMNSNGTLAESIAIISQESLIANITMNFGHSVTSYKEMPDAGSPSWILIVGEFPAWLNEERIHLIRARRDGSISPQWAWNAECCDFDLGTLDGFGSSVVSFDADSDGKYDIAFGTPGEGNGTVRFFFLPEGSVEVSTPLRNPGGGTSTFGFSLAHLATPTGSGLLVVGESGFQNDLGRVHLYHVDNPNSFTPAADPIVGTIPSQGFGRSIADIGDLDGDSVHDLAIGAWGTAGAMEKIPGAVYIYFMNETGTFSPIRSPSSQNPQVITYTDLAEGEHYIEDAHFGISIANIGDLDEDGIDELAVGAHGEQTDRTSAAIWILFLNGHLPCGIPLPTPFRGRGAQCDRGSQKWQIPEYANPLSSPDLSSEMLLSSNTGGLDIRGNFSMASTATLQFAVSSSPDLIAANINIGGCFIPDGQLVIDLTDIDIDAYPPGQTLRLVDLIQYDCLPVGRKFTSVTVVTAEDSCQQADAEEDLDQHSLSVLVTVRKREGGCGEEEASDEKLEVWMIAVIVVIAAMIVLAVVAAVAGILILVGIKNRKKGGMVNV